MGTLSKRKKSYLAIILGNTIFGFSFMASKIALSYTSPEVFLGIRFMVSFFILTCLAIFKVGKLNLKGKKLLPLLAIGICQPVVYFLAENYGIKSTSSSFSGMMIGIIPVVAYLLSIPVNKESFVPKKLVFAVISVVGVSILSLSERSEGGVTLFGVLCLCVAVFCGSMFNVLTRKYAEDFTPFERTYTMFFLAAVVFAVLGVAKLNGDVTLILPLFAKTEFLVALFYLSILSSVVAFFCLNYAAGGMTSQETASFANLTAVISVAAGVIFLKENFSIWHGVGILVTLLGIYMFNKSDKKSENNER
ncbi:MAG: DMT family transporter [Lachnospiraceae bacterium]|jgi:drug/metabolite transporter (DMT)-like permease|nr:DMT family transporter [Lachnospiraceae bacterium]